jgi:hypothetical protein
MVIHTVPMPKEDPKEELRCLTAAYHALLRESLVQERPRDDEDDDDEEDEEVTTSGVSRKSPILRTIGPNVRMPLSHPLRDSWPACLLSRP